MEITVNLYLFFHSCPNASSSLEKVRNNTAQHQHNTQVLREDAALAVKYQPELPELHDVSLEVLIKYRKTAEILAQPDSVSNIKEECNDEDDVDVVGLAWETLYTCTQQQGLLFKKKNNSDTSCKELPSMKNEGQNRER